MGEPRPHEPSPTDTLAAEYALGVLDGGERTAAQRRGLADPGFVREVEAWEARFAGLTDGTAPVSPPQALWSRISDRMDGEDRGADRAVVLKLKRSVAIWRGLAASATGLAACLVLALAWPRPPTPPAPLLTARLSASAQGPAVFVAIYDPARRAIVLTPARVGAPEGRSPELWLIPPGGRPVALGRAYCAGAGPRVSTRAAMGLAAGALAVSMEPKGGSPTGQPTGPVIATGQLSRI